MEICAVAPCTLLGATCEGKVCPALVSFTPIAARSRLSGTLVIVTGGMSALVVGQVTWRGGRRLTMFAEACWKSNVTAFEQGSGQLLGKTVTWNAPGAVLGVRKLRIVFKEEEVASTATA
eukprot:762762-Hanusia_phi.AAC.1